MRKMTVGPCSAPLSGDSKATKPETAAGAQAPPSPRSPLPEGRVSWGSRFWALAGESSDEDEDSGEVEPQDLSGQVPPSSPRSGPSCVTLGDFLSPAWSRVVAGAAAARRQGRRGRFAPGGRGSRFSTSSRSRSGFEGRRPCPEGAGAGPARAAQVDRSFGTAVTPTAGPSPPSSSAPSSRPSPAGAAQAPGQQLLGQQSLGGGGPQAPEAPVPRPSIARPVLVSLDQVVFGPPPRPISPFLSLP
jgi:hypothetical protein